MADVITCSYAKSNYTPCISRDGSLALSDEGLCVGCGHSPDWLLRRLSDVYAPAGKNLTEAKATSEKTADELRQHVADYVFGTKHDRGKTGPG